MHMNRSVRRGVVVAAAVSGLLALSAGSASASPSPGGTAPAGAVGGLTDVTNDTDIPGVPDVADVTKVADAADVPKAAHGALVSALHDAGQVAPRSAGPRPARVLGEGTRQARTIAADAGKGAGKASSNVTQEAGEAVSEASSAPTDTDLGAVSRIPAQAAASSAPGLPEDLVIQIPEVVPGVPSIGVVPLSLPALPVTPGVPSL